jgi:hypothetical protein
VTRKKKPPAKKSDEPAEKPAAELTTQEVIERLFPRGVVDAARERLEPPKRPGFSEET